MKNHSRWMHGASFLFIIAGLGLALPPLRSGEPNADSQERGQTSYMKVDITEPFSSILARMTAAKPGIEKEHTDLLNERYDLSNRPAQAATMSRGKPLQEGVRVKLSPGSTWLFGSQRALKSVEDFTEFE
jgi:hypothetical protein